MRKYTPLIAIAFLLMSCSQSSNRVTPADVTKDLPARRFLVSPDSASIALCTFEKATIWNINLADGARRQIGEEWDCNTLYAWRPKSRQIFFLREIPVGTKAGSIVSVEADTGRTEVVIPDRASYFALSPDGQRLAYSLGGPGEIQALRVMNLESAQTEPVTTGWIGPFTWSIDGQRLLYNVSTQKEYAQQLAPHGINHGYLAAYSIASNQPQQITPEFKQIGIAIWSPDGQWVTFNATREQGEDPEVFLMAADGSEPHSIGAEPGASVAVAWSPQSDSLLFTATGSDEGSGLWQYHMNTKLNTLVAKGNIRAAAWAPDGKKIAFLQDNRLWLIPGEGGPVMTVAEQVAEGDLLPAFQWLSATELVYLTTTGSLIRVTNLE